MFYVLTYNSTDMDKSWITCEITVLLFKLSCILCMKVEMYSHTWAFLFCFKETQIINSWSSEWIKWMNKMLKDISLQIIIHDNISELMKSILVT